ncbi:MAG: PIN domain-containing protein [Chloracidobacterium sp.]|nr:PIN domain-containing protein [Chloracidobacterium sp.]
MILVDSSVWIDYFNGEDLPHTRKVDEILGVDEIVVTEIVVTEVLQGFRVKKDFDSTLEVLDSFLFQPMGGRDVAVQAARNFVYLRSVGFTIRKTVDTLIATKCILSGFQLLHNDRDFIPFETHLGLQTVKY